MPSWIFLSTKSAPDPSKSPRSVRLPRATRLIAAKSLALDDFQRTIFAPSVLRTETELSWGGVASYWSAKEVEEVLPARSVQSPRRATGAPSGPWYVAELQLAIPEVA